MRSVGELLRILESRAPSGTAEDWDNVGLLAGDPAWNTKGAVVSVDLTLRAIAAAKAKGYRLIVNHHPCIFPRSRGLAQVTPARNALVFEALRQGIAVIAAHTNFDRCALEVVDKVSAGLGAKAQGRLIDHSEGSLLKLAVYVPLSHADKVRQAVCDAGAGQIGDYDQCSFSVQGEGTFRGRPGTNPYLGAPGELETAEERRIETVFPRGLEKQVIAALFAAHPYEEVAYDLYRLDQAPGNRGITRGLGYGFWGEFPRAKSFPEVTRSVKSLFNVDGFWVTDPPPSRVRRVAFVAGKGASFLGAALAARCDLFITGEAGYHTALEGARKGMAVLELGHRESEKFFAPVVREWLVKEGIGVVDASRATQKFLR